MRFLLFILTALAAASAWECYFTHQLIGREIQIIYTKLPYVGTNGLRCHNFFQSGSYNLSVVGTYQLAVLLVNGVPQRVCTPDCELTVDEVAKVTIQTNWSEPVGNIIQDIVVTPTYVVYTPNSTNAKRFDDTTTTTTLDQQGSAECSNNLSLVIVLFITVVLLVLSAIFNALAYCNPQKTKFIQMSETGA